MKLLTVELQRGWKIEILAGPEWSEVRVTNPY